MYEWALSMSLESFVQDAPRKELAIGPVVECCITNKLAVPRLRYLKIKKFSLTFFWYLLYEKFLMTLVAIWENLTDKFCQYLKQFAW